MAKYKFDPSIAKTDDGERYYTTGILENSKIPSIPLTIKSRMGDRWDTIAYKYLGNAKYWYKVAAANSGVDGSLFIEPGTTITIPEL